MCIPKVSTLTEDYNSGGFDASVWNPPPSACTVVNQQYQIVTAPNASSFATVRTKRRFDLLESEFRIDLVNPGNQSILTMQAIAQVCTYPGSSRCLSLIVGNNKVYVQLANNAVYTALIAATPLGTAVRFRVREQNGVVSLAKVTDAGTWLQVGSGVTPFSSEFSDVLFSQGAGTYALEASSTTVVFDNLNSP